MPVVALIDCNFKEMIDYAKDNLGLYCFFLDRQSVCL